MFYIYSYFIALKSILLHVSHYHFQIISVNRFVANDISLPNTPSLNTIILSYNITWFEHYICLCPILKTDESMPWISAIYWCLIYQLYTLCSWGNTCIVYILHNVTLCISTSMFFISCRYVFHCYILSPRNRDSIKKFWKSIILLRTFL